MTHYHDRHVAMVVFGVPALFVDFGYVGDRVMAVILPWLIFVGVRGMWRTRKGVLG